MGWEGKGEKEDRKRAKGREGRREGA